MKWNLTLGFSHLVFFAGILFLGAKSTYANYVFTPTGGNLVVGSTVAITTATAASIEGINVGSWRATLADDNFHWVIASTSSGYNVNLDLDNAQLNGANSITIQTEIDLDATTPATLVQICDWTSSTGVDNAADGQCTTGGWRTLNSRGVGITLIASSGTNNQFMWQIYNGYFSGVGETGISAVSTPMANFINSSSTNKIRIRYFSTTNTTSQVSIDFLKVYASVNPIYTASAFTNVGVGATVGVYGNTIGVFQGTQGASDNVYSGAAGTAGSVADFYYTFSNVKTYYGMNTVLVRAEYGVNAVGTSVMPAIYNNSTTSWENLSTTATGLGTTADVTNAWAKNNVTIDNYINSSNQIKVRFYGTVNSTSQIRVDQIYITLGTTNSDNTACEISFGTGTATGCSNTQNLDMTGVGASWNITAEDENTARAQNATYYPGDTDGDATASEEASAAHVKFKLTRPAGSALVGAYFAGSYMSGAAGTVVMQLKDYSGSNSVDGGFISVGAASTTGMTYTDNVTVGTVANGGMVGSVSNPEDFVNTVDREMWVRLKTSVDGGSASNSVMRWDFAMVSISWTEDPVHFAKSYQFSPTGGNLIVGGTVAVTSQTAASNEGVNVGSWKGTLADDNFHWVVTASNTGTTGLNMQLNFDGVEMNKANAMIIQTEFDLDATVPQTMVQICDWVSTTNVDNVADTQCTGGGWRTINNTGAAKSSTAATAYHMQIYDGFWETSTPLGNFVNTKTAANRIILRYFSVTSTTSQVSVDYARIYLWISPLYTASSMTNLGTGATAGSYRNTTGFGDGGSENLYAAAAGTTASIADMSLTFSNIKTYTGMNSIILRAEYGVSSVGTSVMPAILNASIGSTGAWENLSSVATGLASSADVTNAWAKNNITISNYINASNQIKIRFYGSHNTVAQVRVDLAYLILGTTNTNSSNCEISMGTGTATNCTNTRNMDMTAPLGAGSTFPIANIDESTTFSQNTIYPGDWDADAVVEEASSAKIGIGVSAPSISYPTAIFFSARWNSGLGATVPGTTRIRIKDYSGTSTTAIGGFMEMGASVGTTAMTYWDNVVAGGVGNSGWSGQTNNANQLVNSDTNEIMISLVTSVDPATTVNAVPQWDFAMVSMAWVEPEFTIAGNLYSNEGTTPIDCSGTGLQVAGVLSGSTVYTGYCSTSDGSYAITDIGTTTSGDVLTVYINNGTPKASAVTRAHGNGKTIRDLDLYQDRIILRHEDAGPLTNSNIATYDGANDAADLLFTHSGSNVTATNKMLLLGGDSYTPGANLTTASLEIGGTMTLGANILTLKSGGTSTTCTGAGGTVMPLCVSSPGSINMSTGTVNYEGQAATTLYVSSVYNNLGVGTSSEAAAVTYTLGGATGVGGTLTIGNASSTNNDVLDGSSYTLTLKQIGTPLNITSKGTFTPSTSTVNYEGQGATNISLATYYNLGVGTSSEANTGSTYTLAGNVGVGGVLGVGNSNSTNTDILDGSTYTITLTGSGTPFAISSKGSFTANASTVKYLSAGGIGTTISVATSADDGVILQPAWGFDNTSTTIRLTVDASDSPVDYSFHRFQLPTAISAGTSITDARIQVYVTAVGSSSISIVVRATKSANAPQPASGADRPGVGTTETAASAGFTLVTGGITGQYNISENMSNVIQELVDTYGGLAANSYINIWLWGSGGTVTYPTYNTFDDAGATEPKLSISSGGTGQKATAQNYYNLETSASSTNGIIDLGTTGSQNITVANNWVLGNGTTTAIIQGNTYNPGIGVTGNVTINAGTTLTSTSGNLTIGGSLAIGGNFTHNSGTVIFNDASKTSLLSYSGAGVGSTLYNLSVLSAGKTMMFDNVDQTTIANNFTITGTSCTGAGPVYLRSDIGTSQFEIKVIGTTSVSYADVKDSNAINAITASNSVNSGNNTNWTINAGACGGNTAPNSPTSLAQKKIDDTVVATGGWVNATTVKFTAQATDIDNPDTLYLCVEKDLLGTTFSNTEDSCGMGVAYSGSAVGVSVTIPSITDASEYHWQARVKDTAGAYSSWVSYDVNAESARDFGIDTTPPTGGTVYDGDQVGIDMSYNDGNLSTLSTNWASFNSNVSGLNFYEYAIGTGIGLSDVVTWTNVGTNTTAVATGLSLSTTNKYYFVVRANDNASNVGTTVVSNGINIAPTLVFTVSPSTASFSNLNAGNNYTSTVGTTLTTSTNAYNGYVIKAYVTGLLTSTNALYTVTNFNGGTYASPDGWQSADRGFGYNSNDTSVQGSNIFNSTPCPGGNSPPCYAPFSLVAPGDVVADHTTTVSGTPINAEEFSILYKIQTDPTQQAAKYTTTVIYTVVPQY